jgi:hypothetical protein
VGQRITIKNPEKHMVQPQTPSDFEKKVLHESMADYKKGNVISNDEVFSKSEKWLEEMILK